MKTYILPVVVALDLAEKKKGIERLVFLKLAKELITKDKTLSLVAEMLKPECSRLHQIETEISKLETELKIGAG